MDDLHFIKRDGKVEQVDRNAFLFADSGATSGIEMDSVRHVHQLSVAGANMLKRKEKAMIYAIELKPEYFRAEQLSLLQFLPNIEQVQLSGTAVTDDDLKWLVDLPKLTVVALNETAISDQGIQILSESNSLESVQVKETHVSAEAIQNFLDTR